MVTPEVPTGQAVAGTLSLRAYGRHRKALGLPGGNPVAVSRAIATQRLVASVVYVDGQAQIADAALADQEWAANTDHSRAPTDVKEAAGVTSVTGKRSVTGGHRGTPSALVAASTREKNARANMAELEYLAKAGELVSAAAVEAAWSEMVTQMRAAVLSVPSKAKGAMPHLTHADLAQLSELLARALESLPEQAPVQHGAAA